MITHMGPETHTGPQCRVGSGRSYYKNQFNVSYNRQTKGQTDILHLKYINIYYTCSICWSKNENEKNHDTTHHWTVDTHHHYLCYQAMLLGRNSCPEQTECFLAAEYLRESCELLPATHTHQSTNTIVSHLLNSMVCDQMLATKVITSFISEYTKLPVYTLHISCICDNAHTI